MSAYALSGQDACVVQALCRSGSARLASRLDNLPLDNIQRQGQPPGAQQDGEFLGSLKG